MGKVAVKIILKKNVKGNERMVYDELDMLQNLKHPHIVRFVDWFESRVSATTSNHVDGRLAPSRNAPLTVGRRTSTTS